MATLRDLRERRKTVSSIQKITNAMKVVSVSKFRRTQKQMMNLQPYAEKSREIFANLSSGDTGAGAADPYLVKRSINKVCYVLFVGDKGLCGAYNNNVLKYFQKLIAAEEHEYSVVIVGKWGGEIIDRMDLPLLRRFSDLHGARSVTNYLLNLYSTGEADKVVLVYEKFKNVISQEPHDLVLLPVEHDESDDGSSEQTNSVYHFEPERDTVLHSAVLTYLNSSVYEVILEAKAGEHASRMTAMTAATDNTDKLLSELELYMNRVRQADITTEISEIVGGAAALKKRQQELKKR